MLAVRGLGRVLGDLSEIGYDARWCVMGADDVGAPHRRKRIWILAHTRHGSGRGDFRQKSRRFCGEKNEGIGECNTNQALRPSPIPANMSDAEILNAKSLRQRVCGESVNICKTQRRPNDELLCKPLVAGFTNEWWRHDPADQDGAFESQLGRVADGVANRVDRLKAIGNGQVPLVAATAFMVLKGKFEKDNNNKQKDTI